MINWVLAILVAKGIVDDDEAKHLAEELSTTIYETRFEDAQATVQRVLRDYENSL